MCKHIVFPFTLSARAVTVRFPTRFALVVLEEQLRLVTDLAEQFGLGEFIILGVTMRSLRFLQE